METVVHCSQQQTGFSPLDSRLIRNLHYRSIKLSTTHHCAVSWTTTNLHCFVSSKNTREAFRWPKLPVVSFMRKFAKLLSKIPFEIACACISLCLPTIDMKIQPKPTWIVHHWIRKRKLGFFCVVVVVVAVVVTFSRATVCLCACVCADGILCLFGLITYFAHKFSYCCCCCDFGFFREFF